MALFHLAVPVSGSCPALLAHGLLGHFIINAFPAMTHQNVCCETVQQLLMHYHNDYGNTEQLIIEPPWVTQWQQSSGIKQNLIDMLAWLILPDDFSVRKHVAPSCGSNVTMFLILGSVDCRWEVGSSILSFMLISMYFRFAYLLIISFYVLVAGFNPCYVKCFHRKLLYCW